MRIKRVLRIVVWMVLMGFFCVGVMPAGAANKKVSACSYRIAFVKAASILGIPSRDLNVRSAREMVSPDDIKNRTYKMPPCRYGYSSKLNFVKRFSYVVYVYNDPERARRDYGMMKSHFSAAAKVKMLSGLGDAAFYVEDSRFPRLVAVQGNVLVDVMNPKEINLRKQVAALVLEKLEK